jgi:hypothetical protein
VMSVLVAQLRSATTWASQTVVKAEPPPGGGPAAATAAGASTVTVAAAFEAVARVEGMTVGGLKAHMAAHRGNPAEMARLAAVVEETRSRLQVQMQRRQH